MRLLLRTVGYVAGALVALLLVLVLYLSYGDLNRHKGRIESFVSQKLGRPFAIDGTFSLDLFPAVKLEAENIHIGNATWGSTPQMVQVGRVATEIDLWSLVSGPVNVRALELRDVSIVLERNARGESNWTFGGPGTESTKEASEFSQFPIAIQHAKVAEVKVIYRVPGAPDHVATIGSLTLQPDPLELLVVDGKGTFDGYDTELRGQIGPLKSLLSGRDIRLDLAGGLGNMRFTAKGGFGRLHPLDGADLEASIANPDLDTMLRNLRLPAFASGKLDIKFNLKDAGQRTDLDLRAQSDDFSMRVSGKLAVLGLRDSDLTIKATAADAARLASGLGISNVPTGKLDVSGRVIMSSKAYGLEAVHAALGAYETHVDGSIPTKRGGAGRLRFDLTAPNLAELKSTLPSLPLKVSGNVTYKAGKSLLASRNILLDLTGEAGKTRIKVNGGLGRLDPLDGADLKVSVDDPDLETLLQALRLPAFATGRLAINATLKDAGKRSGVDLTAQIGDITLQTTGTLTTAGLRDSDLTFKATAADAARLASAFDIKDVPTGTLAIAGHVNTSATEYRMDGVHATLGAYEARVDGTLPMHRGGTSQLRFDIALPSLAILKSSLPSLSLKVSGEVTRQPEMLELTKLKAQVGESQIQGSVTLADKDRKIRAEIDAPVLDLTPFLPKEPQGQTGAAPTATENEKEKKHLLFGEQDIPFPKLGNAHVNVHLTSAEVRFAQGMLHQVDATLAVEEGQLHARVKGNGGFGGQLNGSIDLVPMGDKAAAVKLDVTLQGIRSGFASGDSVPPEETPPLDLKLSLASKGTTPHQLASAATGSVLLSQGSGKAKSNLLDRVGSDIISQLLSKLNPFSKQDPYTQVDCMVARVDILDGKTSVAPVLMQTRKVAITASGTIDLKTEKLHMNFNTRPRQGIGISPGMFTNPFIDLTGTLTSPSIGIGGKGVTSGAVAAATGGLSVLAKGAVDRVMGETNQCKEALDKAQHPASAGRAP